MSSSLVSAESEFQRIHTELLALFSEKLYVRIMSEDTDLFESGILDSQKFVELLLEIEKYFGTWIDAEDFEIDNFKCVKKIANLILRNKTALTSPNVSNARTT
jgi:acyl carrier protein